MLHRPRLQVVVAGRDELVRLRAEERKRQHKVLVAGAATDGLAARNIPQHLVDGVSRAAGTWLLLLLLLLTGVSCQHCSSWHAGTRAAAVLLHPRTSELSSWPPSDASMCSSGENASAWILTCGADGRHGGSSGCQG